MNKILGSIILVAFIFFPQVSYSLLQEKNTFDVRKKTLINPTSKRDFSSMHRSEFRWGTVEIGIPLMSKMSTFGSLGWGYQFGIRPSIKSPLMVQLFTVQGNYGEGDPTVLHTMQFDNNTSTMVEVYYKHMATQYGLGLRYILLEKKFDDNKFFSPYIDANIGLKNFKTNMEVLDPARGWDDCIPIRARTNINNYTGGIYKLGLGFDFGKRELIWCFFNIGFIGSFRPVEYIDHNFMDTSPRPAIGDDHAHHHHHSNGKGERNVYADFINVFSSDVHSHKIAEIYSSHLRYIYINFGFSISFGYTVD